MRHKALAYNVSMLGSSLHIVMLIVVILSKKDIKSVIKRRMNSLEELTRTTDIKSIDRWGRIRNTSYSS